MNENKSSLKNCNSKESLKFIYEQLWQIKWEKLFLLNKSDIETKGANGKTYFVK